MKTRNDKWTFILAFGIPVILMLVIFWVKNIYPFGEKAFLTGDLYHQYIPFFREFMRKSAEGEGMGFSFRLGIGSNFLALYGYYLASPFHLPALLLPEKYLMDFVGYLMILKTGLCCLTATIYLRKHFQTQNPVVVLFALFYAFSGYMAAYSYNIMWVDCVWLLPLILMGIEMLVIEGKGILYCIALGLCIYTNFYLSIMVCLFLVLYFVVLISEHFRELTRKQLCSRVGEFALFSLLAGGIAAVLLIPEVCALLQTDFGDMNFPKQLKVYFSALDVLARHCVCVSTERGLAHWPNIYCGSMVLLLIPLYVMNTGIPLRGKIGKLGLVAFFVLSFRVNLLDFIWHGMNFPDSLPGRQSFIYILLILLISYEAFSAVKKMESKYIWIGYLWAVGFYLFCDKFVEHDDFETGVKFATFLLVTAYSMLLYLYRTGEQKGLYIAVYVLTGVIVMTECAVNMANTGVGTNNREAYMEHLEDYEKLYRIADDREDGLFRIEQFNRKTKNDSQMGGFTSGSLFSSTLNSQVMDLYTRLGMRHSKVYYCADGSTPFTAALLNIKYMYAWEEEAGREQLYGIIARSGDVTLYQSHYSLPFGYVIPKGYDLPEGYEHKALDLQNRIVNDLGNPNELFLPVPAKRDGDDIRVTIQNPGNHYAIITAAGTAKVNCIGAGDGEMNFKDLKKGCILELGYLEKGQEITLTNGDEKDETPKISADIYVLDIAVLQEILEELSENYFHQTEWESDFIAGNITMEEPGRVVLSVPSEPGWRATINGEAVEPQSFGGALIAFDLEPGYYEISLKYHPKGKIAGILVSTMSILALAGIAWLQRRKEKNNKLKSR